MNLGLRQLIDRSIISPLQEKGARLLTKAALFILAAGAFFVTFIFLTAAFFIWIVQLAGPLIAALSIAGFYFSIGLIAVLFAIYGGREKKQKSQPRPAAQQSATSAGARIEDSDFADENARAAAITEAVIPLLEVLRSLGWKREELALLASAELAKKLPPLTLVGLAIICGFLIGRMKQFPFDLIQPKKAA